MGVFALAAEEGLTRVTFAEIAQALSIPVQTVADRVALWPEREDQKTGFFADQGR